MPSPVGHALGGLVAAFVVNSFARRPRLTVPVLAASAAMAVAPDLDLLVGFAPHLHTQHRRGGARRRRLPGCSSRARHSNAAVAAVLTAAYASHLVLDWLSKDTSGRQD